MDITTTQGVGYVVTCKQSCTIEAIMPDGSAMLLNTRAGAGQVVFVAICDKTRVSDDEAVVIPFESALMTVLGEGGAANVLFDEMPISGSSHAVTSNGVYVASLHAGGESGSVKVGELASAQSVSATAIGCNASAGVCGTSLGRNAASSSYSLALGFGASASSYCSGAIGNGAKVQERMSFCSGYMGNVQDPGLNVLTSSYSSQGSHIPFQQAGTSTVQLYLIAPTSPMANTYCGGEAGLGFIQYVPGSGVVRCGTRKLSELCTEHTKTSSTPFVPTGLSLA